MANRYWVQGTGNWSDDDNHWATSSGGSPANGNLPTADDDVFFDANSFGGTGQVVTVDAYNTPCKSMDWSNVTNNPDFKVSYEVEVYGSMIFSTGMTVSATSGNIVMLGSTSRNVDTKGISIGCNFYIDVADGDINFLSDFYINSRVFYVGIEAGGNTVDARNISFRGNYIDFTSVAPDDSGTNSVLLDGTDFLMEGNWSELYLTGYNVLFSTVGTSIVFNGTNGELYLYGDGVEDVDLTIGGSGNTINYSADLKDLTISAGKTLILPRYDLVNDNKVVISGSITMVGESENLITLQSSSPGTQAYLSKTSGFVECDYLNIKDCMATGGAYWFAGENSVNNGNNTGWVFDKRKYPLPVRK